MIGLMIFILGISILSVSIAIHLILSMEMSCLFIGGYEEPCYTGYSIYKFPFIELLMLSIVILIAGTIIITREKNRLLA